MSFIKDQIEYLKDNPEGYWFKRKLYGWGWTPATKEGWFLFTFYIFSIVIIVVRGTEVRALVEGLVVTILFLFIVYLKGEPARWQWGKKDADED